MAKIENTTVYPLTTPSADDFIIGTDTSDDNRTVSFSISTLTAAGGLQGLQSVLDTSNVATQNINLTGNITVVGTVAPTTITAAASTGTAGQVLSSTGTGIQWVAASAASCCSLDDTLTVGNTTAQDINTTGNISMSGAATSLAFTGGSDITLAVNSDITTSGNINLSGATSVLNFGATAAISDYNSATGSAGQILTVNPAGTGVEWSTGVPVASMPTLQQVLTAGDTAVGNPMNLTSGSILTLDAASNIISDATNTFTATNTFSANGTTNNTSGIGLTGSLWDGTSTGTVGQVLTSTATGVSWATGSGGTQNLQSVLAAGNTATNDINLTGSIIPTTITDGVASVGSAAQYLSSTGTGLAWATLPAAGVSSVNFANTNQPSLGPPIVVNPNVGNVLIESRIYGGGSLQGNVPPGGSVTQFLQGDGTWAVPPGAVTSVSQAVSGTSTGPTDAIKVTPSVGLVTVASNAFDGSDKVGHVPDASAATGSTDFLRADGTWATPAGGSSGFGGLQTFMLTQAKTGVTANNYMTLALNNTNTTGDRTVFSTDLGSSSPAVMAGTMTDGQHVAGCFLFNPVTSSCLTATTAMKCCDIYFQYLPEFSGHNWTLELWKTSVCTTGTYTAAGSATVSSTAGTLACDSITFVSAALQTLQLGEAYFITVRQDSALTANDFLLNLTVRYEMVA